MRRRLGFVVLALGLCIMGWTGVTLKWGDPFTSLYTAHKQSVLSGQLAKERSVWTQSSTRLASPETKKAVDVAQVLKARAALFGRTLKDGEPIGRILIPKIGLNMVVVEGTSEDDLMKGPGHYNAASGVATSLPGAGGVVAIAGHRTTFLHPFRYVDQLRPGDNIYLEMPYGTLRYRVYYQKIVTATDWSILNKRPYEKLVLSACHPLYSASHRIVTFARLVGEATQSSL